MKRGRPSKVQSHDIINIILVYKNRIFLSDKIVSKHDTVWSEISVALGGNITPVSLYTMASCNTYNIRNLLVGRSESMYASDNFNISDNISNESSVSINSKNGEPINFIIMIFKEEFEELIVYKLYKRLRRNKRQNRLWKCLRPGIWEEFITSKIWDSIQLKCGFRFRNHYLSNIDTSGYINGKYVVINLYF